MKRRGRRGAREGHLDGIAALDSFLACWIPLDLLPNLSTSVPAKVQGEMHPILCIAHEQEWWGIFAASGRENHHRRPSRHSPDSTAPGWQPLLPPASFLAGQAPEPADDVAAQSVFVLICQVFEPGGDMPVCCEGLVEPECSDGSILVKRA